MSDNPKDYGILLKKDIKLFRQYFKEMVKLLGINCQYYAPKPDKEYDLHGELDSKLDKYYPPIEVGCIFDGHPDQKTLKKMGWVSELQTDASIIHVPYDLENLQVGALFSVPSGLDFAQNRLFRVISMSNIMVYPASITCEIAPEYEDIDKRNLTNDFKIDNMTLLIDNEGED